MGNYKFCDVLQGFKPILMMITVQISLTGVNVFYKLAANRGISLQVVIAYRFIFAVPTLLPLALILNRKKLNRPKLTWNIAFQGFICALFGGSMAQNLYAESLALTSATYAAATSNIMPAMTFIFAIIFGMERLGFNTTAGKAKVVGTLMCIGGAMLLTFYKGCEINIWSTHFDLLHKNQHTAGHVHHKPIYNFLGPLLAFFSCFSAAFSLILQTKLSEIYPCHYSSTALISIMGSLQAIVYALCTEKDLNQWKLGWDLRLLIVAYMGILGSGIVWGFTMASVRMRGPLFVSVFNPFMLVLVALAGSLLLNEKLHLGSVLGAAIIVSGLYMVLWGKSKEMKKKVRLVPSKSFSKTNDQVESETESFKGFNHGNVNVLAVTPNFVAENEIVEVFDDEEEEEDFEAKTPNPHAVKV
ncbi:hypothetical protein ACJIZ3_015717 [Penstemon smallii]|uniref:WAT1-related protein n=1 Tax=Penstemon smallii TaxID=265156 RepID=A0ABD3RNA8_9LAMI